MLKLALQITKYSVRSHNKARPNSAVTNKKYEKFLDLIKPPTGSQISITQQQKDKVNEEIDKKLQELEDTGLSREQILLSKSQKGLPLKIDPFFQFIKHNRLAREVYLKETDRFTAQKVVDIALRQDIGVDPSYSRINEPNELEPKGRAQYLVNLGERGSNKFDPQSYFAGEQFSVDRAYTELKKTQPVKHIYKPIDKYEKMRDHLRKLKKYDIHWRNVELLRQFVTKNGNIRNRLTNLLSVSDQKNIERSIKTARQMAVMPHYGRTPEPLKKNITTLEDDVEQIGFQHINIETGHIYYTRTRSMDSVEVQMEKESDIEYRHGKTAERVRKAQEGGDDAYQLWSERIGEDKLPEEVRKVEQYARFIKKEENSKNNRKEPNVIQERAMKKLTGLDVGAMGEKQARFREDGSEDNRRVYEKKKTELKEKLEKDPLAWTEQLVQDKFEMY